MHIPVLLHEVIEALHPEAGEFFIDGTFGGGGHAQAIHDKIGSRGTLLALDWEEAAILKKHPALCDQKNVQCVNQNFAMLPDILREQKLPLADGLLLDLGFSSDHLENSGKGFSFLRDEPLMMTYGKESVPVYKLLATLKEEELAKIIRDYGEERYARQIASAIRARQKTGPLIMRSKDLAEVIQAAVPRSYEHGRIHPATRTFQALRIYVNQELENLQRVLERLPEILKSGGRVAIISFHSLEDRIVKQSFRKYYQEKKCLLLTEKPIVPTVEEVMRNPRARSAKLRAAQLI